MINKIIHFSVFNRFVVVILALMFAIAGVYAFKTLPIDAVPDITNNQVQVNTTVEGLIPEEIERLITFPIESAMRGAAGVDQVRSITRFGLSQVTVVFKDNVDIYRARQLVSERLQGVSAGLPSGTNPRLGPITTGLGEIYIYSVDFAKPAVDKAERLKQLMELKSIQSWFIKPRLMTVEGLAEVNTSGGYDKQYHVEPNRQKMAEAAIHFSDIQSALEKTNQNVGGGYVEQTAEQYLVQGVGLLKNAEDIEQVPVKTLENFRRVTIGDVANVSLGKELRTGAATHNGHEVVLGTAMMLIGGNSRTISQRVHARIDEIRKTLPPGIEITTLYNRSDLVNQTLATVEHNLFMGAGLVVIILLLLLGNVRAAVITAVTIPLSLLITFLIMKPLGISGNLMSLGALDFGIIVDGTVIVLDNCVRYIQRTRSDFGRTLTKDELLQSIYEATVEIRMASGFGQLIVVMVFLPIFGLTGIEGKMFFPMASTFVIAVLAALVLSFTVAPALASFFLTSAANDSEFYVMTIVKRIYLPVLNFAYSRKWLTVGTSLIAIVIGVILFMTRGSEFLPQLSEGSFAFHMIRPVNVNLTQSIDFQERADQISLSFPEVKHVFANIGSSEVATDPMGVNVSDAYIILKPRSEWPEHEGRKYSFDDLTQAILAKLERELPGQTYLASQPIQMRFNELLEGTRADVAIKVYGPDLKVLVESAKKIQEVVSSVKGAGDIEVDLAGTSPVLKIEPKTDLLKKFGASTSDVLETVAIAVGGKEAGSIFENERKHPIIVRLDESERSNLETIRKLPVGLDNKGTAPLSALASVKFTETYGTINREDSNRRTAVLINLRGRDTESFVTEAQGKVEQAIQLPEGYYIKWGGNFENLKEAKSRLLLLTPMALVLVLMMIYAAFGSVGETFLIFSCVPLALVGGVLGLMLNGLPFSISAGIGFIALSGIAVLNGVVLVNYFNQLKAEGYTGKKLVFKGASTRLRPVLMTALVAIFGFVPMMISTGVGAEVQRPLASVVIGGIISSTLLTLIVLPVVFSMFESKFKGRAH